METSAREDKQAELEELRDRVSDLERQLQAPPSQGYTATGYYGMYHATAGAFLGMFGAIASLLFNVVGSTLVDQYPLRIIQVYLTFPLGEKALTMQGGITLVTGCCLYIATGMLLGVPMQMALAKFADKSGVGIRLAIAGFVGLIIWVINFYFLLSWIQPWLIGGNWITDPEYLPPWVAILTHLVFAWTMALTYPLGAYRPYRLQTEQQ